MPVFQLETGAERLDDMWSPEELVPLLLHVADAPNPVALHAEADVDPTRRQREAPHVARQQVGLEPHDQTLRRRPGDVAGVLAESVPFAEVAGLADAQRLASRRPHPVRGDDVPGLDRSRPVNVDCNGGCALLQASQSVPLEHVRPGLARQFEQGRIELAPRCGGGKDPVARKRHTDLATRG